MSATSHPTASPMEPAGTPSPALDARGISMEFDGVRVLDGVSLTVQPGEIHALLGLNGSGKSTLVKCLTGVYDPTAGEVSTFGTDLPLPVRDPAAHGIAVVHQDAGFASQLTVLENLGASTNYGSRMLAPIRESRESAIYAELLERLELSIPMDVRVSELSSADIAMLAVIRALHVLESDTGQHVFILDEPTATLGRTEAERVLELMRAIARTGAGVIFIGHRLREVFAVCDRTTILRDGRVAHTGPLAELDHNTVVQHMLGEKVGTFDPQLPDIADAPTVLRSVGLSDGAVHSVSLEVKAGEILGITGLLGMGQERLPALLSGGSRAKSGHIEIDGSTVELAHPRDAINAGIARIPANRLTDGCWLEGSARENVTLPILNRFFRKGWLRGRSESEYAANILQRVGLRPAEPERAMASFSGGNQQKVMFAKWDQLNPRVFVLHEPTQGVDPSAGREILDQVIARARTGTAVVIVAGDHEQLVEMCHRVIVMSHGEVVTEIPREDLSEESLLLACSA